MSDEPVVDNLQLEVTGLRDIAHAERAAAAHLDGQLKDRDASLSLLRKQLRKVEHVAAENISLRTKCEALEQQLQLVNKLQQAPSAPANAGGLATAVVSMQISNALPEGPLSEAVDATLRARRTALAEGEERLQATSSRLDAAYRELGELRSQVDSKAATVTDKEFALSISMDAHAAAVEALRTERLAFSVAREQHVSKEAGVASLLASVREREEAVSARESQLESREIALRMSRSEMSTKEADLARAKAICDGKIAALDSREYSLLDWQGRLRQQESDLKQAKREFDRKNDALVAASIASAAKTADLEAGLASFSERKSALAAAEANVRSRELQLTTAEAEVATAKASVIALEELLRRGLARMTEGEDMIALAECRSEARAQAIEASLTAQLEKQKAANAGLVEKINALLERNEQLRQLSEMCCCGPR